MTLAASLPLSAAHALDDGDVALARRIAGGDVAAFEGLMRQHNRRLYRLARAMLRDDAEAEDALQEAYLAAHRAAGDFRGEARLATWLSRLVTNECLGRMRKRARRENVFPIGSLDECDDREAGAIDSPRAPAGPDAALVRTQMRSLLERKLDALPVAFRSVFVLRAVEELNVEETARSLGIPEATVRTRYFRARSLLRESLAREMDLAERDLYEFGGRHCDRVVGAVLARIAGLEHGGRPKA
jgi:RNA polymerase sigma-70 factor (ECF subfamily)